MARRTASVLAPLCALALVLLVAGPVLAVSPSQWGLERVRAPEAWEVSRGGGRVVAVVDTGVDLTHPDLAPRLLRDGQGRVVGRDEVDGDHDPQDGHGHGTLVAGVAAAAADAGVGGTGIAGVAPRARIMPVRVLDDEGRGSMADLDAGIRWAVDHGADVINLSLESAVPVPSEVMATGPDQAVRYAWERGVPVVAAAGNTGTPFTDYRSSTPVLLVGATDRDDRSAAFSDGGRSDMVHAPGVDIVGTSCGPCGDDPEHGYARADGTSLAAPHAAGALALLLDAGLDPSSALERLRATAVEVSGSTVGGGAGHGRIDVAAAVGTTVRSQGEGSSGDTASTDGAANDSATATPEDPDPEPEPAPSSEPAPDGAPPSASGSSDRDDQPTDPAPSSQDEAAADERAADETVADDRAESEDATAGPAPDEPDGHRSADAPEDLGAVQASPDDGPGARVGALEGVAVAMVAASLGAVAVAHRWRWP